MKKITSLFSHIDRNTMAWGSIALAVVILISINTVSAFFFNNIKADLTEQKLFTISKGTEDILKKLDEPINIKVYYSKALGQRAPTYGKYFERVRALLEQYRDISRGKLQLTFLEPEPFTDAEDRAVAAGLKGINLNTEGDSAFFGLVATNSTDTSETIPFFSPDREKFLEYDITKMVYNLANPKKPVIGLIAGVNIDGGMTPQRQFTQPWIIMRQMRNFYEVKTLQQDVKTIPSEVDILMVVQPDNLSTQAAYAIDQFSLAGGKVLAFVDPVAEHKRSMGPGLSGLNSGEEFAKLLKAWGVEYSSDKAVGDLAHARRVQFGGGGRPVITEYVSWLNLNRKSLDQDDVLSAGIEQLNLASAGFLKKVKDAKTTFTPVIKTSSSAMEIEASRLRILPDAVKLLRDYRPGDKSLALAARITGEVKSAFEKGRPEEKVDEKEAGKKENKSRKTDANEQHLKKGRINAIVVADTDMLHDQFWVDVRNLFGQQVLVPYAHNATFVLNALDNLSGSESLIALRGRGVDNRPFELVNNIRRDAERRYREKEQQLLAKLKNVQEQLDKMENRGDGKAVILSEEDKQKIEEFRNQMISIRRDLREVKYALRKDIDQLDGTLKFANIGGVPLAMLIVFIALSTYGKLTGRRA